MTLAEFRIAYPEFERTPGAQVQVALDSALLSTPASVWGDRQDHAQGLLAAHWLALSPGGKASRKDSQTGTTYGDARAALVERHLPNVHGLAL